MIVLLTILLVVFLMCYPTKSKKKSKKFGEGLLADKPDSGRLNIWKF